jgi:hypothetical protein
MGGFYVGFSVPDLEPEEHDFYCGVDCTCSCEGCSHEICCESSGAHRACVSCEWQGCCLKNKGVEVASERGGSVGLAG